MPQPAFQFVGPADTCLHLRVARHPYLSRRNFAEAALQTGHEMPSNPLPYRRRAAIR